ncbi:Dicer-like protein 1 [Coemansia sp. RSA 552]|nr:Dicer-like protein 1 [Coemansia sp. RSA 552]
MRDSMDVGDARPGPAPKPGAHVPRDYQQALFQRALNANSIVMLETGTGKTLVAAMLIQWFAQRAKAQARPKGQRKKVRVFLNNTVTLVQQQARVIAENTGQVVREYSGSASADERGARRWDETWNSTDVLVMTHQILLNALRSGLIRITDIDLLVFDECHHARGNHPYTLIMREFYDHCAPADRPHIFGMTASPLNAHQTAEDSVMHLQASLDSDICTIDLTASAQAPGRPPPLAAQSGLCYEYRLPPEYADTPLTTALSHECAPSKVVARGLRTAPAVLSLLGPFGVDHMWHYYIRQWHRSATLRPVSSPSLAGSSAVHQTSVAGMDHAHASSNGARTGMDVDSSHKQQQPPSPAPDMIDSTTDPLLNIQYLKRAVAISRIHGGVILGAKPVEDALAHIDNSWHPIPLINLLSANRRPWAEVRHKLSPQVNRLLEILYQWHDRAESLRGIVFVNRRVTAVLLVYIVSQIREFSFIKADVLLGVAGQQNKSTNNPDRPIRAGSFRVASQLTLADFGEGRLNLVFATQVAEEGVDIQPCNLVIRFDLPKTATSLIQSRGRARMADSQFIVMVPKIDAEKQQAIVAYSTHAAPIVQRADDSDSGIAVDISGAEDDNMAIDDTSSETKQRLSEHRGTYMDYLKLVGLEESLREWCRVDSQTANNEGNTPGGVITTSSRTHQRYSGLLHSLRETLTIDNSPSTDLEEIWVEQHDSSGRVYTIVSTQARITYLSSISTIHSYVQKLPQDMFCKLAPRFDFEEVDPRTLVAGGLSAKGKQTPMPARLYRCMVVMPANAAVRRVAGPVMPNKRLAKQAAAYRTAKKLHQLGAIDDSLAPVIETLDDFETDSDSEDGQARNSAGKAQGQQPKAGQNAAKGAKTSIDTYSIAVPQCFIPPSGLNAPADSSAADDVALARSGNNASVPWCLYMVTLKHPSAPAPTRMVLATVDKLPPGTVVPLMVNQYSRSDGEPRDESVTDFVPEFIGTQVLDHDQIELLASYSSKILVRALQKMLVWDTAEVGCLLAPPLADGTGIDFDLAASYFADRSVMFREGASTPAAVENMLVMDGLDQGNLKVIDRVCLDIDMHADLRNYHYRRPAAGQEREPEATSNSQECTEASAATTAAPTPQKNTKRQREAVRTLAEWAGIKRVTRMLPPPEVSTNVPLLKVRYISQVHNYLALAPPAQDETAETKRAAKVESKNTKEPFPSGLYSSPFFCAREPLDIYELHNLTLLPAVFVRLEHVVLAHEVKERLRLPARTESVREALTSGSSNMDKNYERLETLGDAVLKYIVSVMLFVSYPDAHEGMLTSRRGRIICNANLFTLATRLKLPPFINTQMLVKRDIRLPGRGWRRLSFIPSKWICSSPFAEPPLQKDDTTTSSPASADVGNATASTEDIRPADSARADTSTASNTSARPTSARPKTKREPRSFTAPTERILSEKTIADIIESLLGACVRDEGIDGALTAARSLGVVDSAWDSWATFARVWQTSMATRKRKMAQLEEARAEMAIKARRMTEATELLLELELDQMDVLYGLESLAPSRATTTKHPPRPLVATRSSPVGQRAVASVEDILGYTFKDRSLLTEALTHCSSFDLASSSYQRLEFLGDAVLDYFLTKRYYDHQPPLTPHRMTLVKHIAASNDLFAVILVSHGLHRHIKHNSPLIGKALDDYECRLDHARTTWRERTSHSESEGSDPIKNHSAASSRGLSWADEESAEPPAKMHRVNRDDTPADDIYHDLPPESWNIVRAPKVLGDILESLIGAVYVDSGMNHVAVQRVYERVLCPFLSRFVDTGKLSLHPVIQSLLICQGWGCNTITWEGRSNPDQFDYLQQYMCDMKVHDTTISTGMGESPRHAKYNASNSFLQAIGATAPNALDGDLSAVHSIASAKTAPGGGPAEDPLSKLLKPICKCAEQREGETAARVAAEKNATGERAPGPAPEPSGAMETGAAKSKA